MTDAEWISSQPGPHDTIFALGVISLGYGQLENMFSNLFELATGMTQTQVAVLFQRIQNDSRLKIFTQLAAARHEFPTALLSRLSHFAKGYGECATNRNAIMHAHSRGMFLSEQNAGLVLAKFSKSGDPLVSAVTIAELRQVAEDIHTYTRFGASLCSDLHIVIARRNRGVLQTYEPDTWSDKPHLPKLLDWMTQDAFRESLRQP